MTWEDADTVLKKDSKEWPRRQDIDIEEWPRWQDIEEGRVFIDESEEGPVKKAERLLSQNRFLLIRGAEGRGKTVLTRTLIYRKCKDKWYVRYRDLSKPVGESELEHLKTTIKGAEDERRAEKNLFVIENANDELDTVSQLLDEVFETTKPHFIFVTRTVEPATMGLYVDDPFEDWEARGGRCIELNPTLDTIKRIVNHYIEAYKEGKFAGYQLLTETEFQKDFADWVEREIGNNLRRLSWYLEVWNPQSGPLWEVNESQVLRNVLKRIPKEPRLEDTLLTIAAVYQYGIRAWGGTAFQQEDLRNLVSLGLVGVDRNYYRLAHPTDADYIVKAIAGRDDQSTFKVTNECLQKYLKQELRSYDYINLFRALHQREHQREHKEREHKGLLQRLMYDEDTFKALLKYTIHGEIPIQHIISILGFVSWADSEKGQDFWTAYKKSLGRNSRERDRKLRAKLVQNDHLLPVNFLLIYLKRYLKRVQPNEAKRLAKDILSVDNFTQLARNAAFGTILKTAVLLTTLELKRKAQVICQRIGAQELGQKARKASLQDICWFLNILPRSPQFTRQFLESHGIEGISDKLRNSAGGVVSSFRKQLRKVGCADIANNLVGNLTRNDWIKIWEKSGVGWVSDQLYRYLNVQGKQRQWAKELLDRFASRDLRNFIREIKDPNQRQLKALGKFLNTAYQLNSSAAERLAKQAAEYVDLQPTDRYTLEELSLFVSNIRRCNNVNAYNKLLERIALEVNLTPYVVIPFDKGLAALLWDLRQSELTTTYAQDLLTRILLLNLEQLLKKSDLDAVSLLLWNSLQIDFAKAQEWIKSVKQAAWIKALKGTIPLNIFWALWTLYQADENLSRKVAKSIATEFLKSLKKRDIASEDLPLIGLFTFFGLDLNTNLSVPLFDQLLDGFSKLKMNELAFSIRALQVLYPSKLEELTFELTKHLFIKTPKLSLNETLDKYPFPKTHEIIKSSLNVAEINCERIFKQMILLTQSYFEGQGLETESDPSVPFGKLMKFLAQNPPDKPLFKDDGEARAWISLAIKHGVYCAKTVPHSKIPDATVTLIYLDCSNPLVQAETEGTCSNRE